MFSVPDLPYAYNGLEPAIDERTMQIHHDKHHAAYVKNLNDALAGYDKLLSMTIEDLLQNLAKVPEAIRTKVRNNGGGHANHCLFWQVMGPPESRGQGGVPGEKLGEAIKRSFGSFSDFQAKFTAAGLGRFGSGWVWLVADHASSGKQKTLEIIDTPNQDTPFMEGIIPIVGLDVWEHAYYLKYQNMRADYIKAWWSVVNWKEVERRYAMTQK